MKAFASKAGSRGGSRSHLGEDEKTASPATVTKKPLHQQIWLHMADSRCVNGLDENVTHIKEARYNG